MMPPPETPAPSRFLPLKRPAVQAKKETTTHFEGGSRQFAATPRFSVTASPRPTSRQPPPFSTPAPVSARPKASRHDPISDTIDTSPLSSSEDSQPNQAPLADSIEIDSPTASRSPAREDGRSPKRRRISLSPEILITSPPGAEEALYVEDETYGDTPRSPSSDRDQVEELSTSPADSQLPATESEPKSPAYPLTEPLIPTFQNPPKFKASEVVENVQPCQLPDAFSPQRRGSKYVPGGLAAELRDWLVQVKGSSEYDRPEGSKLQLTIDSVRPGGRMWLVEAHKAHVEEADERGPLKRVILAGDGRITGLGRKSAVKRGMSINAAQPVWDITLGSLGQFAVACDWEPVYPHPS